MSLDRVRLFSAPAFHDKRGGLFVLEKEGLPLDVKRFYCLFNAQVGLRRGEHAHKTLHQLMVCFSGSVTVTLDDGECNRCFKLTRPDQILYVPPGLWRNIDDFVPETVVGVFASDVYDTDDYIYDYEEYVAWVGARKG